MYQSSLYSPRFEHDACGIGAVVDLREFTGGTVNVSATIFVDGYTEVGAVGGPYEVSGKIITS